MTAMLAWVREDILAGYRTYQGLSGVKGYKKFLKDKSFIESLCGDHISRTLTKMVWSCDLYDIRTYTYFNDIYIVAKPGDSVDELQEIFLEKFQEQIDKYNRSFRAKISEREMQKRKQEEIKRKKEVQKWVSQEKMKVKIFKTRKFRKARELNESDRYSARVFSYAEEWAVAMQRALRQGKTIPEVADELGDYVNYDGVTGFMHGCAAKVIAAFWKHGEEFRRWYNIRYQFSDEGEKANKKRRTILNPGILRIGSRD
jgi:hypothetical protein